MRGLHWLAFVLAQGAAILISSGRLRSSGDADNATIHPLASAARDRRSRRPFKLEQFNSMWRDMYQKDKDQASHGMKAPLPASIKMVLGVMSVPQEIDYRKVLRSTWINQRGVCYWSEEGPREGCSVYVAFVMGKHGAGTDHSGRPYSTVEMSDSELEAAHNEPGALVLDIEENMNEGKSFAWFSAALEKFPWATHIGKMDLDTYPHLYRLVPGIASRVCTVSSNPYEYFGRPSCRFLLCDKFKTFQPLCSRPEACTFKVDFPLAHGSFEFMSGAFYALSMPLVERIPWKNVSRKGVEDHMMAKAIHETAKEQNFCVAARQMTDWWHTWP